MDFFEFIIGFSLEAEVIHALHAGAFGYGEIDTRIIQHPFRVVGLKDGRLHTEHGCVKTGTLAEIADRDVDVKAFHDLLRLKIDGGVFCVLAGVFEIPQATLDASSGAQPAPAQQFSVRNSSNSFMVVKLAE